MTVELTNDDLTAENQSQSISTPTAQNRGPKESRKVTTKSKRCRGKDKNPRKRRTNAEVDGALECFSSHSLYSILYVDVFSLVPLVCAPMDAPDPYDVNELINDEIADISDDELEQANAISR